MQKVKAKWQRRNRNKPEQPTIQRLVNGKVKLLTVTQNNELNNRQKRTAQNREHAHTEFIAGVKYR